MDQISAALLREGRMPMHHRRQLSRLRREWPVLFEALRHHVMTAEGRDIRGMVRGWEDDGRRRT